MKTNLMKSILMLLLIMSLTIVNALAQQDKKLENSEAKFCTSITNFVTALENLDVINSDPGATMDEFNKAYKEAEKAYNKFEKAATKLEKVEIKESQKAYNELVDAVSNIDGDTKTSDATGQINGHIDATAAAIDDISTVVCK